MRLQGLRSGARTPTWPPCYATRASCPLPQEVWGVWWRSRNRPVDFTIFQNNVFLSIF